MNIRATHTQTVKALWAMLLIACAFQARAQAPSDCQRTLVGQVLDAQTRTPVPAAVLHLHDHDAKIVCDAEGRFSLPHLCAGDYRICVHCLGYHSDTLSVNVSTERQTAVKLQIAPESRLLQSVQVLAQASRLPSELQADSDAALGADALGERLQSIAGVSLLRTGASVAKPVIDGLSADRVPIVQDGLPLASQRWGADHAPEIDPLAQESLRVAKGAESLRYGPDAIGGAVYVEPPALPKAQSFNGKFLTGAQSNGSGGYASLQAFGGLGGKLQGFGYRLQGSYKRLANRRTPNYHLDNTALAENHLEAALGYGNDRLDLEASYKRFASQLAVFEGAHIGNLTDLQNRIDDGHPAPSATADGPSYAIDRPYQDILHQTLQLKGRYRTSLGEWHLQLARQQNDRKEFDAHWRNSDRPALDFTLYTYTANFRLEHKPLLGLKGQIGASGMRQANIYDGQPLIPNYTLYQGGLFLTEAYSADRFRLEGGFRYDYRQIKTFTRDGGEVFSDFRSFHLYAATLEAGYFWENGFSLQAIAGLFSRAPGVNELFSDGVHHSTAAYELGDPSLQAEKAVKLHLTLAYESERAYFSAEVYSDRIDDFIYQRPGLPQGHPQHETADGSGPETILTLRGAFPAFHYAQTDALLTGLNLKAGLNPLAGLWLDAQGSLLRARDLQDDQWLLWMPADRLRLGAEYRFRDTRTLQQTTLRIQSRLVERQYRLPQGVDFAPPPPAYALFDLKASTWLRFSDRFKMQASLALENAFDAAYRDYLDRFRYFADSPGRNLRLGLKIPVSFSGQ